MVVPQTKSSDDCKGGGVAAPPPDVDSLLLKASYENDDATAPQIAAADGATKAKIANDPEVLVLHPAPQPISKPTWTFDVCYDTTIPPPALPLEMAERQVPLEVWKDFWLEVKANNHQGRGGLIFAAVVVLITYAIISGHLMALYGLLVLLVFLFLSTPDRDKWQHLRYYEDGAFRDYGFSWTRHVKTNARDPEAIEYVLVFHDDHANPPVQRNDAWTVDLYNRDTVPALPEAMKDRLPLVVWTDFWLKVTIFQRGGVGNFVRNHGDWGRQAEECLVSMMWWGPILLFPILALVFGRKAAFVFLGCLFSLCLSCQSEPMMRYDKLCQAEEGTFRQYGYSVSVLFHETDENRGEDDKMSKKLLLFQEIPEADVVVDMADDKQCDSQTGKVSNWSFELRNRKVMPVLPDELSSRISMTTWKDFWLKVDHTCWRLGVGEIIYYTGILAMYTFCGVLVVETGRPVALLGYVLAGLLGSLFRVGVYYNTQCNWKRLCREEDATFRELGLSLTKQTEKIKSGDSAIPVTSLVFQELDETETDPNDEAI